MVTRAQKESVCVTIYRETHTLEMPFSKPEMIRGWRSSNKRNESDKHTSCASADAAVRWWRVLYFQLGGERGIGVEEVWGLWGLCAREADARAPAPKHAFFGDQGFRNSLDMRRNRPTAGFAGRPYSSSCAGAGLLCCSPETSQSREDTPESKCLNHSPTPPLSPPACFLATVHEILG